MRRAVWCLAAIILLAAPTAPALHEGALEMVGADLFLPVPPSAMEFETGCGGGAFEVADDNFRFYETDSLGGDGPSGTLPGQPSGYFEAGCGWARAQVAVPSGLDHMHVRFVADRSVDVFDVPGPLSPGGDGFVQEVHVEEADGRQIYATRYFAIDEPSHDETFIDLPRGDERLLQPRPGQTVTLAFYFQDLGYFVPVSVRDTTVRRGIHVLDQMRVSMLVDEAMLATYGTDLRVVARGMQFSHLVLPDGTAITETATRRAEGPLGFDPSRVLTERYQGDGVEQVTVPRGITANGGSGEYVLVFESLDPRVASPALGVVALVLLAVPLPLAFVAAISVRRFERVAFGGYRRAARNLFVALLVITAFYLSVVVSALVAGRLALMATWPLGLEGWLLYLQIIVAGLAFVALWRSAHNLYDLTQPRPIPRPSRGAGRGGKKPPSPAHRKDAKRAGRGGARGR